MDIHHTVDITLVHQVFYGFPYDIVKFDRPVLDGEALENTSRLIVLIHQQFSQLLAKILVIFEHSIDN